MECVYTIRMYTTPIQCDILVDNHNVIFKLNMYPGIRISNEYAKCYFQFICQIQRHKHRVRT